MSSNKNKSELPDGVVSELNEGKFTPISETKTKNGKFEGENGKAADINEECNGMVVSKEEIAAAEQIELLEAKDGVVVRVAGEGGEGEREVGLTLTCNCRRKETRVGHIVNIILVISNMLNYMDRFTIAGLLEDVEKYYGISKSQSGLLQSSFIISYMIFSPLFGYLGDRFNRKYIMASTILFWSGITLASSFIPTQYFGVFLMLRGLVGVGEAGYSTVTPTIIADMFSKSTRSIALSIFYFAIPVGSGLGYIVGSNMAKAFGEWQWALRATPGIGVLCTILIMVFVDEPERGSAEGGTNMGTTSFSQDLIYLIKNKSFMLSSAAFTCVSFVAGALAWWGPTFVTMAYEVNTGEIVNTDINARLNFIFGVITCLAGFSGVALGGVLAAVLRRYTPRADPIVCGAGLIGGAPMLLIVIVLSRYSINATWVCVYIGETLVSLNWALVTDILLYVVVPTRRALASALQIFLCHLLGDAGSPYLVGLIYDTVMGQEDDSETRYVSMQSALYMTCFVCVLGGGFFLATALYVHSDRTKANQAIKEAQQQQLTNGTAADQQNSPDVSPNATDLSEHNNKHPV